MSAATIAAALGGTRHGDGWLCRCPVTSHGRGKGDRRPSLLVRDDDRKSDGIDTHCFAGCDWRDVKAAFVAAGHLQDVRPDGLTEPQERPNQARPARSTAEDENRAAAREIWRTGLRPNGSAVERYLRARAITLPIPPTIRYLPGLKHGPTGLIFPAMVGAVQAPDRTVSAVHRTFLRPTLPTKAAVSSPKMALGCLGAGAVRLAAADCVLGLAEGIETGLSAMQMFGCPVWCALGSRLAAINLPDTVVTVRIFADNGPPGIAAAEKAAIRFTREGRTVELLYPPTDCTDWNDSLRAAAAIGGAA